MCGLGRYYEIDLTCVGEPDPRTGYLVDIRQIDTFVRSRLIPIIAEACRTEPTIEPAGLLPRLAEAVTAEPFPSAVAVRWRLSPCYAVEMGLHEPRNWVELRVRFDFAAAHRLHVATLSDEENRRIFGHCNNPNSHGHNYQIEPCVRIPAAGPPMPVVAIEQAVRRGILDKFDHTNLNCDTVEFANSSGVNPSVENMARVFFGLLAPLIADAHAGAALVSMTVWETDRTCATYGG
jgi:6-pyruvoyltetrahydropterin/6-carboxytetrahydropterin synthase